jgi:YebC/PmpR family DNA-binding regulatory protein
MSGHNKWSSIKHKKGAADKKRAKIFTRIIRELTIAARIGGGDPKGNPRLRTAVQAAKDANMPKDTMTNAIKKGTGEIAAAALEECTYEGYGPGGTALLIEVVTDNKNRIVSEIRNVFTKQGGNMGESGCVGWMFDRKGHITVEGATEDQLMEVALDAGADDIASDGEGMSVYTAPDKLEDVRKALEDKSFKVTLAEKIMVPQNTVPLDEKAAESLLRLISKLEEMDDVQNVYSNYSIEDAVMEKIAERI